MGIQVGRRKGGPVSDPNVVPFIDVCLVLLIIFMVVVVLLIAQLGFLSKLPPQARAAQAAPLEQIVVRVASPCPFGQFSSCRIFINRDEVPLNEFVNRIAQLVQGRTRQTIFFTADDEVNYENAIRVLDMMRKAGVRNIGFITEKVTMESLQLGDQREGPSP